MKFISLIDIIIDHAEQKLKVTNVTLSVTFVTDFRSEHGELNSGAIIKA